LRFKEFTDEWDNIILNDIAEVKGGKRLPKGHTLTDEKNQHPYITVSDMENGSVNQNNIKYVPEEIQNKISQYTITDRDIFISVAGQRLGILGIIPPSLNGANLTENADKITNIQINQKFLYHSLETSVLTKLIQKVSTRNAQPKLALKEIRNIKLVIPQTKQEQEKISNFLDYVDKKIELMDNNYQYFKAFKKYLLQNIFAQKLRFDGFNEEWKKTYLKDIGTFYRGHSYNSSNVVNEGLLVLRSNNIQNNTLNFDEDELQFVNKDCKPELNLLDGDIVICMSNGTKSLVGKSAQYNGNYNSKLTVGAFCSIFRSDFPLAPYIFQSELYKKYSYLLLAGTNINNLKNSDLEKLSLYIPSLEEQEKIANFLSSVDQKIDLLKDQISQMEDFKRGLLQSLFVKIIERIKNIFLYVRLIIN